MIHRDLKPSNILVVERDGEAVPKIIDFGLARATERNLAEETVFTEAGVLIGTPEYMSPEQAQGAKGIDTRTDIYSLGVLLYELLGRPFDLTGADSGTLQITVGAAGEVSGVVTDEAGSPLSQARVVLVPDSVLQAAMPSIAESAKTGLTGEDGRFRLSTALAPGSYTAFAWADPTVNDWTDGEALKAAQGKGCPVRVTEGSKTGLDLRAIPAIR